MSIDAGAIAQEYERLVAEEGQKQSAFGKADKALGKTITRVLAHSHKVKPKMYWSIAAVQSSR